MDYKQKAQYKVQQAVFNLNGLYYKNKITYPRVDNGYFGENYNMFPHPDIKIVNSFCEPLNKKAYNINRNTVLLYLGHKGLVTASSILSVNKFISTVFDEKLKPLNTNYLSATIDKFMNFCNTKKITLNTHTKSKITDYPFKYIYSVRLKPTPITQHSANEKEIKKSSNSYSSIKKSINCEAFMEDSKIINNSEDFFEALNRFKIKRKLLKLREKYAC